MPGIAFSPLGWADGVSFWSAVLHRRQGCPWEGRGDSGMDPAVRHSAAASPHSAGPAPRRGTQTQERAVRELIRTTRRVCGSSDMRCWVRASLGRAARLLRIAASRTLPGALRCCCRTALLHHRPHAAAVPQSRSWPYCGSWRSSTCCLGGSKVLLCDMLETPAAAARAPGAALPTGASACARW